MRCPRDGVPPYPQALSPALAGSDLWTACSILVSAEGPAGRLAGVGEGQGCTRGRVSLKWSWEGEPTWAAVRPDGL